MSSKRRGVKFQHRGSSDLDGRRPSFAELSDAMSDPGSPLRQSINGHADTIKEEVRILSLTQVTLWSRRAAPSDGLNGVTTTADFVAFRKTILPNRNMTRRKRLS